MASSIISIITGNLGGEPRLTVRAQGDDVCNFNVAVNRTVNGQKQVLWIRCAAFGRQAAAASQFLHKGDPVQIETHWLTQQIYEGQPQLNCFVDRFTLLGSSHVEAGAPQDDPQSIPF